MAVSAFLGDLFEPNEPEASFARYAATFDAWLEAERISGHLRGDASARVYTHMWAALATWATTQSIPISRLDARDLETYLATRGEGAELSPRYALRLMQLVDRVLQHHHRRITETSTSSDTTPAAELVLRRPEIRFAGSAAQDPLPAYLDAPQARRLVAFLGSVRADRRLVNASWQDIRNCTSVALMLGAGLTPAEVRALTLADVIVAGSRPAGVPWKVNVAPSGGAPAREAPLAKWAGRLLEDWLAVRQSQAIPGTVLLPSTRSSGKTWSKRSQHIATSEVLAAAGLDDVEGGSYRLRHTFAIRQLRRGRSPAEVARWLGIIDLRVMDRYLRVVPAPVDVA